MYLELHDQLRSPTRLRATRVVIYDDHHNPVGLVLQLGQGHIRVCHAGEDDFLEQLRSHGIPQTVVVTQHDLGNLRPPRLHSTRKQR